MASTRYVQIIEGIFQKYYKESATEVNFKREDIINVANELGIDVTKNAGDVIYSFRYRQALPKSIVEKAKEGYEWIIRGDGRSLYRFVLVKTANFLPNPNLVSTKIPDATPGIITKYAFDDEQALLAKIRYNRLIDIFTGVTCYSLQNHFKTTLPSIGQVETDELYIGIDKQGAHYVFPVQAKGGKDKIGTVQIEQDFGICEEKFPAAIGRPIAAQFMDDQTIALFEFVLTEEGVKVLSERHYRLVHPDDLSDNEIDEYRKQISS